MSEATQPTSWTYVEDEQLVAWGMAAGYDFVATHDLGKPQGAGTLRMEMLRADRPSFVARIEAVERRANAAMETSR